MMKTLFRSATVMAVAVGTTVVAMNPASASVSFGTSWDTHCAGGTGPESCSLQNLINKVTTGGPQIDTTQDSGIELFTNTSIGGAIGSFMFSIAGNAPSNTFGIYKATDPNTRVQLFGGGTSGGAQTLVSFLANGSVSANGNIISNFGQNFGFYLQGPDGTFYSQNSLNGGAQQAVIYQGNDKTQLQIPNLQPGLFTKDQFLVAFEDRPLLTGDRDYNDLVVMVSDIKGVKNVPEPASLLGLGLVGVGLAGLRRRKAA
jgi:Domain of unknown function (DUF4114)/PEP-CTERM motif